MHETMTYVDSNVDTPIFLKWLCEGLLLSETADSLLCVGVGTRNYYRKMGYELEGPYMTKFINPTWHTVPVRWSLVS